MKKHHIALVLVLFISTFAFGYSGGTGTEANPYQIATKQDLLDLGANTSDYDKYYIMTADIDLAGESFSRALIAWNIDGDSIYNGTAFTGSFNGNGHTISNLTVSGSYYCGLFGKIGSGGTISNLGLENVSITGTGSFIGGLCGYNSEGSIASSYATGSVKGNHYVGGLCGYNYYGSMIECYAMGSISGTSNYVGGLCGYNKYGSITFCYVSSSVSGNRNVGGLCGYDTHGIITFCYAMGSVSGNSSLGGLCGYNHVNSITSCYATNSVTGTDSYVGGLYGGDFKGTFSNCYYYIDAGPNNGYGVPLNDEELQQKTSFAGFDFVGDDSDGSEDIWDIESGYMPRLTWQDAPGFTPPHRLENISTSLSGNGYADDPFIISSYDDLIEFRNNSSLRIGYYSLSSDIDLAGVIYSEAFIPEYFIGIFQGNGHFISNLTIDGESYLGFFGHLFGSVNDLGLENVSITGTGEYVGGLCGENSFGSITECYATGSVTGTGDSFGGLCGYNSGSIASCYVTGSVSGSIWVGGLCGYNESGSMTSCYAAGIVSGDSSLGGLCGYNSGSIIDCNAAVTVSGEESLGGLCGVNYGSITDCYATGSVTGKTFNIGGLCGYNHLGNISDCYATGSVSGINTAGGLCGWNQGGSVLDCYATGSVSVIDWSAGGLCGNNSRGSITGCYATGSISGYISVGGLCGYNYSGSIAACYATGTVIGVEGNHEYPGDYVGGLCGYNHNGSIRYSYAIGNVTGAEITVGGFCGYQTYNLIGNQSSSALIENCFWDVQTSGQIIGVNLDPSGPGTITNVQGLATAELQIESTFTDASWDFNAEIDNGTDNIWHMPFQAAGYPMLYWQRDIPADITGGYGVNFEDFEALASQWMIAESEDSSGITISNDNTCDLNDLQIMAEYWLVGIY